MTKRTKVFVGIALALAGGFGWYWLSHSRTEADDPGSAENSGTIPVAAVVKAERRDLGVALTLAGAFKPFQDVDIHAKVAGYIKAIYVDVGIACKRRTNLGGSRSARTAAELAGADAAVRRAKEEIRRAQGEL